MYSICLSIVIGSDFAHYINIFIEFCFEQAHSSSQNTVSSGQYFDGIEDEIRTLVLEKKASNKEVFEWINVSALSERCK